MSQVVGWLELKALYEDRLKFEALTFGHECLCPPPMMGDGWWELVCVPATAGVPVHAGEGVGRVLQSYLMKL